MSVVYRKEIKYIIGRSEYLKIANNLNLLLKKDTHGDDGKYMIRSQYYDSLGDRDLYDNLDGMMEKQKIRVRIYSTDSDTAKLEYKTKSGSDGVKYSINITREEALLMEKREFDFLLNHPEPLAKQLYVKIMQYAYMPKTIIEYNRIAYMHEVCDLRITFDTEVRVATIPQGIFSEELSYIPIMDETMGVLEIKYNGGLPAVFKKLVQEIDRLPEANSKYTKGRVYL